MSIIEPNKVASIIRECAATYVMPRYKALAEHEISSKTGPRDLVTQADLDVEEHLIRVLPDLLPGSIVIGEEGVSKGLMSLDLLQDKSRPVWIVDPVDGTHNFVHHKREFGSLLALVIDGRTEYGWIYDAPGDAFIIAERGAGAFAGEKKLSVKSEADISSMNGHINPGYFPKEYRAAIKDAQTNFKSCHSLNCAAHEYWRVASGQSQFVLYSRLKPWDHLAGVLAVQEAGGYAAKWDGRDYTPQDTDVGLIVACDQASWQEVFNQFLRNIV